MKLATFVCLVAMYIGAGKCTNYWYTVKPQFPYKPSASFNGLSVKFAPVSTPAYIGFDAQPTRLLPHARNAKFVTTTRSPFPRVWTSMAPARHLTAKPRTTLRTTRRPATTTRRPATTTRRPATTTRRPATTTRRPATTTRRPATTTRRPATTTRRPATTTRRPATTTRRPTTTTWRPATTTLRTTTLRTTKRPTTDPRKTTKAPEPNPPRTYWPPQDSPRTHWPSIIWPTTKLPSQKTQTSTTTKIKTVTRVTCSTGVGLSTFQTDCGSSSDKCVWSKMNGIVTKDCYNRMQWSMQPMPKLGCQETDFHGFRRKICVCKGDNCNQHEPRNGPTPTEGAMKHTTSGSSNVYATTISTLLLAMAGYLLQ